MLAGFFAVHGFSSATAADDIAEDDDGRDLIVLYVGDFDPSGMLMSEEDLPGPFAKYAGDHIKLKSRPTQESSPGQGPDQAGLPARGHRPEGRGQGVQRQR